MKVEVDFFLADKHQRLMRHVKPAQNNKLAISLQFRKKEVSDEVHFLHVDKHESFL